MNKPLLAYHDINNYSHLAYNKTAGQRHLICTQNLVIINADDWYGYQVGEYNGDQLCDKGFTRVGIKSSGCTNCIRDAYDLLLNDGGYWLKNPNWQPTFASSCGTCAIGCVNGTDSAAVGLNSGCYINIPVKHFSIPAQYRSKNIIGAKARIKGYSDRIIECSSYRSGSSNWQRWSVPYRDFLINNSIFSRTITPKSSTNFPAYDSECGEMIMMVADANRHNLTARRLFFLENNNPFSVHLNASTSSQKNLKTIWNTEIQHTWQFSLIGCNKYAHGTTIDHTNGHPLNQVNTGTVNHQNHLTGSDWGAYFSGIGGTFISQTGGFYVRRSEMPNAAVSDTSWLASSYIEFNPQQLQALKQNNGIWVMLGNPSPWFNTTDQVDLYGAQRQIWIEDYRLELDFGD